MPSISSLFAVTVDCESFVANSLFLIEKVQCPQFLRSGCLLAFNPLEDLWAIKPDGEWKLLVSSINYCKVMGLNHIQTSTNSVGPSLELLIYIYCQ